MRRAVIHSLPEAIHMRGVQSVGIEADPSTAADSLAEGQGTVVDGAIDLGLREVPHRSSAVAETTVAPLIVHGP